MQFCFPFAAALACVLFLSACAEPAPSAGSLPPSSSAVSREPESSPAPEGSPAPESSGSGAAVLFDPEAADYRGNVTEATGTGFLLAPAEVEEMDGTKVMASAGGGRASLPVLCSEETDYVAIYADTDGNSRQEAGDAGMIAPGAFVYLTGSRTDDGFAADTVAFLNP